MPSSFIQPSFARGEVGADLRGRVDVQAYKSSLRTGINVVIHSQGGVSNRAGLRFIGPMMRYSSAVSRLIGFKYNTNDAHVLEFGNLKMRVIRNDAHTLNTGKVISGATVADPVVITATSHGFTAGTDVYIDSIVGMTELNNRWFTVANPSTHTFELTDQQTGADIDGTGYTAYASGGEAASPYEIATPYAIADVAAIRYVQSANVMTLVHPSYPVMELSRLGLTNWQLEEVSFAPEQASPVGVAGSATAPASTEYKYKVTAINDETKEESLSGLVGVGVAAASATAADPVVVTATGHGFLNGDEVEIRGFNEMTEVNNRRFIVANKAANTFELEGEDGSGYAAETTGGTVYVTHITISNGASTPNNTITIPATEGSTKSSIYREDNGLYGWIGDTETGSFTDDNIDPDMTLSPPQGRNPFFGEDNYPSVVAYYEQRRVFANTNNKPDTIWYTVAGATKNLSVSSPSREDDAITATLNATEVDEVTALTPRNDLLVFTKGSEWRVNAGTEAAFTAETLRQKPQSSWGVAPLDPLVVGDKILYTTQNLRFIRSFGYEITVDGYKGNDMTVFAPHILKHNSVSQWALSLSPDPVISIVREDGIACSLTFNPEQEVVAWSRWYTDGKFMAVTSARSISTAVDTYPYFIVKRRVGGSDVYYIERLASRRFVDKQDCFFVDCGLSLDNPLDITNATEAWPVVLTSTSHGFTGGEEVDIYDVEWEPDYDEAFNATAPGQLNGRRYRVADVATHTFSLVTTEGRVDITGATQADPVEITAEGHGFSDGDVIGIFDVFGMTELNNKTYKVANAGTNTFELTTLADADVDGTGFSAYVSGGQIYLAEDGSEFNDYVEGGTIRETAGTVGNLWHLEGCTVVALADGSVLSDLVVENGEITFDRNYSRVHIGLRYVSDVETLDPEFGTRTVQGKPVQVPAVTLRLLDADGLLVGPDALHLTEMKQRVYETYGEPTQLLTGDKKMPISSVWENSGRVFLRQVNPLPFTLLALIIEGVEGDEDA